MVPLGGSAPGVVDGILSFLPANIYKHLSDVAIKELKKHNATTRSTPPPKRAINTHGTDPNPEQPPTDTPTGDPTPLESPADPDLDNTEPCEAFTFDDSTLEHIMDTYSPSYSINKNHIYHVSKHSSSHYGSLIDRGANGGLAGSDVRILERTGRTVSVTGIDNHELPGLDIDTCAVLLIPTMAKWFSSCMNIHIMVEATPSTLQVKMNGSKTPVMTNPSMWEGNKLSTYLMTILPLSNVGQVSCI